MAQPPQVSIVGAPPAFITAGRAYSFSPGAIVIGGGLPRFEIENPPHWASFSSFNGGLYGMPTEEDVGTYPDIRISVTDGINRASLPAFAITVGSALPPVEEPTAPPNEPPVSTPPPAPTEPPPPVPQPQSISLSWIPPTENTDGTPLANLAGYRIYSGPDPAALAPIVEIGNPGLTRYVVELLDANWLFFAVTAVNLLGEQSDLSQVVSRNADVGLAAAP